MSPDLLELSPANLSPNRGGKYYVKLTTSSVAVVALQAALLGDSRLDVA
jgi:hypothetical protein